jgi:diguanylate cyclase
VIPPDEFIPLAEETRQIIPLGITIFRRAALYVKNLIDAGHFEGRLAINISTVQLEEGESFLETIRTLLDRTGFDPHRLEVEITETFVMKNPHRSYAILEEIHALGITIALDDFGTGYSSLNQLNKYPIDLIKIDKSFIDEIPEKEDDTVVTKSIIALAKSLQIPVLAEGVETEAQREFLQSEGCDFAQGYLISRPLNESSLFNYLKILSDAEV